nr:hypothetical protein [Tanacetum cinerariifolium]
MDLIIPHGQKITLDEYMIFSDADNRLPMLDKDLYDSWKNRMELYMQNKEHEIMIPKSVENGPLIWPTVEKNGVTRTKKYVELSAAEKIQANCDMKATNIILQGLPADFYSLVNHHKVSKDLWERVQLPMQAVLMANISNYGSDIILEEKAMLAEAQEAGLILNEAQLAFLADTGVPDGQAVQTIIPNKAAFQTENLDTYDSDCDDILNAKAILMANISNYGSDIILEAQQDSMISSVIEQMSEQMINHMNNWEKANKEQNNESLTTELERCKERVKTFEQHLNIDLSTHEKMIDY